LRCFDRFTDVVPHVRANGIDIHYRIDGDGAPTRPWLVFSHAIACDLTLWDPQAAEFSRALNVLRLDTRGHGRSSAPPGDYSLELLADDLKALLDALGIRRCHFVGLSMGGMIGQMAALRSPLRFASLTLVDTSSRYPPEFRSIWEQRIAAVLTPQAMSAVVPSTLERWFTAGFRQLRPDVTAKIGALIRATPVAGYVGCARALARLNLTARLGAIDCPTLVVVGEEDRTTPLAMAEDIVRAISGARLERIPGAAHLSSVEQPDRFNAALRSFLLSAG
jgi:3-oxoadipate enol-lactonase